MRTTGVYHRINSCPVVQWCSGAVVQWCSGAAVQWCSGAVVHWCTGAVARASDSQLREAGFESCAAVKLWSSCFTLHCSGSFSCMNEYLAIERGGCLCTNSIRALLDAF